MFETSHRCCRWVIGGVLALCLLSPPFAHSQDQELSTEDQQRLENMTQRVKAFISQRNFSRASGVAERMVERFPRSAGAWQVLMECHLYPGNSMRNDSRAEEAVEKLLELGGRTPRTLHAQAAIKFRQRRPETLELISGLVDGPEPVLRGEPAADLRVMRARLLIEKGDDASIQRAREDLSIALRLDPAHSDGLIERAALSYDDGEVDQALEDLHKALNRRAGDRQVHFLLSRCYRVKREMDKARHHREVADLINRLIDSLASTSAPTAPERRKILERLKAINPKDLSRRSELASMMIEAGDFDQAQRELGEIQSDFPYWPAAAPMAQRLATARAAAKAGGDPQDGDDDVP